MTTFNCYLKLRLGICFHSQCTLMQTSSLLSFVLWSLYVVSQCLMCKIRTLNGSENVDQKMHDTTHMDEVSISLGMWATSLTCLKVQGVLVGTKWVDDWVGSFGCCNTQEKLRSNRLHGISLASYPLCGRRKLLPNSLRESTSYSQLKLNECGQAFSTA